MNGNRKHLDQLSGQMEQIMRMKIYNLLIKSLDDEKLPPKTAEFNQFGRSVPTRDQKQDKATHPTRCLAPKQIGALPDERRRKQ